MQIIKSITNPIIRSVSTSITGRGGVIKYAPCAEYITVYNAMTTKPADADIVIQNTMLKALVDGGYYAKAKVIDIFATHSENTSLLNWKRDLLYVDPALVSTPAWTQYKGYLGSSGKGLCSNFTPSVHGVGMLNNMTVLIGDHEYQPTGMAAGCHTLGAYDAIALSGRHGSGYAIFSLNDTSSPTPSSNDARGHWGITRGAADHYHWIKNGTPTQLDIASTALPTSPIWICGNGHTAMYDSSTHSASYFMVFEYLTEVEVAAVQDIMNTYLTNYGTNIY